MNDLLLRHDHTGRIKTSEPRSQDIVYRELPRWVSLELELIEPCKFRYGKLNWI